MTITLARTRRGYVGKTRQDRWNLSALEARYPHHTHHTLVRGLRTLLRRNRLLLLRRSLGRLGIAVALCEAPTLCGDSNWSVVEFLTHRLEGPSVTQLAHSAIDTRFGVDPSPGQTDVNGGRRGCPTPRPKPRNSDTLVPKRVSRASPVTL